MKTLAIAATAALIGLPAATQAAEPTVTNEKGIVLECSGTWRGNDVYASLYENNTAGNTIQIVIADGDVAGGGRDTTKPFKVGRDVRGVLTLKGKKAVVAGTAHAVGKRTAVHEEHDDAGQHITVDGTHRRLVNDLTFTWKGTSVPLDCATAFVYDLQVTKESVVD